MRKQPHPEQLSIDLAAVEARFDAWLGRQTDFATLAQEYHTNRLRALTLSDTHRRAEIAAACERALARQSYVSVRRRKIEQVRKGARTQRRLTSAAVRRASEPLWEASRVHRVRLRVAGQSPAVPLPAVRTVTIDALIASMENDARLLAVARQCEADARAAVVAVFEAVAASTVWAGEPLRTVDGWTLGYTEHDMFNPARCAELAPSFGLTVDALKSDVHVAASQYWHVVDAQSDDDHDGQFGVE